MAPPMWNDTDLPLGYLITFRCYGTWLHGDERGSIDRFHNRYSPPTSHAVIVGVIATSASSNLSRLSLTPNNVKASIMPSARVSRWRLTTCSTDKVTICQSLTNRHPPA
jgi:hypothetical protein